MLDKVHLDHLACHGSTTTREIAYSQVTAPSLHTIYGLISQSKYGYFACIRSEYAIQTMLRRGKNSSRKQLIFAPFNRFLNAGIVKHILEEMTRATRWLRERYRTDGQSCECVRMARDCWTHSNYRGQLWAMGWRINGFRNNNLHVDVIKINGSKIWKIFEHFLRNALLYGTSRTRQDTMIA